jgi:putative transcriptional regulator
MGYNFYNACLWYLKCFIKLVLQQKRRPLMRTRIKELRARYNLTQDDLARKVGVRRETILYLEKGKYNPSLKLAHDVAMVLKTTIDNLFIFENQEKNINEI